MKKKFALTLLFLSSSLFSQTIISLDKKKNAYYIPCEINGIPLEFIFDTGATNVTISSTEADFLFKHNFLTADDIKESIHYRTASGEIREGTKVLLREFKISGQPLYNVTAIIVHNQEAPLLLGMSALNQLGSIEIKDGKLIVNESLNKNNVVENVEEENKKIINWLNHKLIKHQYETNEVRQILIFKEVTQIGDDYFLGGERIQESNNNLLSFTTIFLIPLSKINNINFEEKEFNYWMIVKTKNAEKAIIVSYDGKKFEHLDKIEFIIDKSIDNQGLKAEVLSAIEYLIRINKISESNLETKTPLKIEKYAVEGGFVEQIGDIHKDGWIRNSYDEKNRLIEKLEAFIDKEDKIQELKFRTTSYNPETGTIRESSIANNFMMRHQLIGEYKGYYPNGSLEVEGYFYDFFKNGHKTFFGGVRIGVWKWYLEDGASFEEEYKAAIEYWPNGDFKKIYSLYFNPDKKSWIKHGLYYEFPQGELNFLPSVTKEYNDDNLINEK